MVLLFQSGRKPLIDPKKETLTMVVNGQVDERNFRAKSVEQYSDAKARFNELIIGTKGNYGERTCALSNVGLEANLGYVGGFVDGKAMICGGYRLKTKEYLRHCQSLPMPDQKWERTSDLNSARAYSSSFTVPEGSLEGFYIAGGYNSDSGFMDTVEKFDPARQQWLENTQFKLPTKKSHFCTVYYQVKKNL